MNDLIIIGKGPAGISASLYTTRANIKTTIIAKDYGALIKASKIENYYGFKEPISGKQLLESGEQQAKRLGVELIDDEVISIEKKDYFYIKTINNNYVSKVVLLATGQPQKKLNINNLEKFEGNGISYCTTCDGFFYKNLKVGVIGNKDYAIHEAKELQCFTNDITIFTNGDSFELSQKYREDLSNFNVNQKRIVEFSGNELLENLHFDDSTIQPCDGIFIAQEPSSSNFARKLGLEVSSNDIVVDNDKKTSLDGMFAAGDCIGGFKQIAKAVSDGAIAAKSIIQYLRTIQ